MKPANYLPPDPIDTHLSRWLKNWVAALQPPREGRQALMARLSYQNNPESLVDSLHAISRWVLFNLLVKPFDFVFEPVLFSTEIEGYPVLYHREHGPTLVMRSMSQTGLPYSIGQLNLVT